VVKPIIWDGKILLLSLSLPFSILLLSSKYWKLCERFKLLKYLLAYSAFAVYIININVYKFDIYYFKGIVTDSAALCLIYSVLFTDMVTVIFLSLILYLQIGYLKEFRPIDQVGGIRQGILSAAISITVISRLFRHLISERDKFHLLSISDSLTPTSTMSHSLETGQKWLSEGSTVTLLIIDTDRFKQINNTYGYSAGNKVLIQVAQVLKKETMELSSIIGRMGGNEFIVLVKDSNMLPGLLSRRIYNTLKNKLFILDPEIDPIRLSFAIGEAHSHSDRSTSIERLLNNADKNMFINKFKNIRGSIYTKQEPPVLTDAGYDFLNVLAEKDMYTFVHSGYTAYYASLLALELKLPSQIVDDIYTAGWLHDIGKTLISSDIIRKSSKLTDKEYLVMKNHVDYAISILKHLNLSQTIINGVKHHHENWNGTGYPESLSGENISLEGRIVQIADSFSAMIVKRVYRDTLSHEEALLELRSKSGIQFDPNLVSLFVKRLEAQEAS
jgi:diguanylate cyclase (GGDEF)-like protein/putative nucleotidyltransferase with HDIG domain